jgi:hypothetical protein
MYAFYMHQYGDAFMGEAEGEAEEEAYDEPTDDLG